MVTLKLLNYKLAYFSIWSNWCFWTISKNRETESACFHSNAANNKNITHSQLNHPSFAEQSAACANYNPGIEPVQALAGIYHSTLCCYSNKTHALTAYLPSSAQLEGTLYHSLKLHLGLCSSARDRQADRHTDSRDQYTFRLGYASCEM